MNVSTVYLGGNSWIIELNDTKILIDPWLTGSLEFPIGKWLIEGKLAKSIEIPKDIDLILLTQGQPDHTHIETLKKINLNIPVIGSSSSIKIAKSIGFKSTTFLKPGMNSDFQGIEILATKGAPVPTIENGYIIRTDNSSIYIEPHGFIDKEIVNTKLDIVITPVINISIPIFGSFIRGKDVLCALIDMYKPSYVLASTVGGDISFKGILTNFFKQEGTFLDSQSKFSGKCNLIDPVPGRRYNFIDS